MRIIERDRRLAVPLGIAGAGLGSLAFSFRLPGFPLSNFRLVGVAGGPGVFICNTLLHHFGLSTRELFPTRDRYVDEAGFQLDRVAAAP